MNFFLIGLFILILLSVLRREVPSPNIFIFWQVQLALHPKWDIGDWKGSVGYSIEVVIVSVSRIPTDRETS
ncbi:hypothetical protein RIR_jg40821.t2 [Rhizophagus irregularis DAOM 181602=DAOM 197198]|nr:hypothetical protein RIR_jg40821.t2 [Rhizophagus irregularis DAOM 181602=DAOM 197198]